MARAPGVTARRWLKGLASLIERLGFEVVHTATPTDFIISDNPVIYYDPEQPSDRLRPYDTPPARPAVLIAPLTRRLLLRGRTGLPILKTGDEIGRVEVHDEGKIERLNGLIARFGYRFVFAVDAGLGPKLAAFADHSPIAFFQHLPVAKGSMLATRFIFGTRPDKPRWTPADAT